MATLFLLLIYLTIIGLGLGDPILGSAWPVMRLDLGAGLDAAGYISPVVALCTTAASLMADRVIKRFGTGRVMMVATLTSALAMLGNSFAENIAWLMIAAVPLGLAAGVVDTGLNNFMALRYSARHMSWLHGAWGVGAFLGPLVMAAFIGQDGNWRGGYGAVAVVKFVIAALLLLSLPMWKKREALPPGHPAEEPPAGGAPKNPESVIRLPGVVPSLAVMVCYTGFEMGISLWGSSFLVEARGFSSEAAAGAASLYFVGVTVGRFLSGAITARMSGAGVIRLGIGVALAGALLLALPVPAVALSAALFIMGLGVSPVFPIIMHETPRRFGAEHSGRLIGWQMATAYGAGIVMPPILGVVAAQVGIGILPWCSLLFGAAMMVTAERVERATRHRTAA